MDIEELERRKPIWDKAFCAANGIQLQRVRRFHLAQKFISRISGIGRTRACLLSKTVGVPSPKVASMCLSQITRHVWNLASSIWAWLF